MLRAHVFGGSDGESGVGEALADRRFERRRDAEITDDRVTRLEEDVLGLDVPVHDPGGMGVRQGISHIPRDAERVLDGQSLLSGQPDAEGLPFDVGHDEEEERPFPSLVLADLPAVEQREDVGVAQLGGDLDFAEEPG